jgi:hypothetical protein
MSGPTTTGSIDAKLTVDDSDFKRGMAEAKAEAKEVGALEPTVKVDANVGPALAKLSQVAVAEQRLEVATRQAANSASTSYVANERLRAMQEKRGATELQLTAATEAAARADRNAEASELKLMAATKALSAAKAEEIRKSQEQVLANEEVAASDEKTIRSNNRRISGLQVLLGLAPAIVAAAAPVAGAAVGLGAAFGVMGVSGVLAIMGIKQAMEVGDTVGNTYAAGLSSLKGNLDDLAGTSANAMLSTFNRSVSDVNARMPFLTDMVGSASAALGTMGNTALRGVLDGLQTMNPLLQAGQDELGQFVTWLFSFNGTNGFTQFINYSVENLPSVMHLIENLVVTGGQILSAFAPLGPVVIGFLTGLTDGLNNLPLPVLAGLVTSAVLLGPALRLAFAPGVSALIVSVGEAIGFTGVMANLAVPVVGVLTAVIAGIGVAAASASFGTDKGTASLHDYTQALKDDSLAIGEHVQAQVAKELVDSGAAQAALRLGLSLQTVQQAALGNATAIEAVKNVTDEAAKGIIDWTSGGAYASEQNKRLSADVDLMRGSVIGASGAINDQLDKQKLLNEMMHPTSAAMTDQAREAQSLAEKYGTTVAALQSAQGAEASTGQTLAETTIKMQLQNDAAGILKGTLDTLNGKALSAAQAQNAFDSSLANMGDHVDKVGKKVEFTTTSIGDMSAASVALRGQLNGQVANLQQVVEANGGLANSTGKAREQMVTMRQQIIDNAVAHGVDKDAVSAYIDKLMAVPASVPPTKLDVDNAAANQKIAYTKFLLDSLRDKTIFVNVQRSESVSTGLGDAKGSDKPTAYATGGRVAYLASGGVPDFKPMGTDTVPAMLTPDEFVMQRGSAKSIGHDTLDYMNRTGQLPPTGQTQQGGPVTVNLILDGKIIDTRIVDLAAGVADQRIHAADTSVQYQRRGR